MVKSKLQKFIEIFEKNNTVIKLLEEFGIDFTIIQKELFNEVLFPNDNVIQDNTVLALSENPEKRGTREKFEIVTRDDNNGDLNDTWINIYSIDKHYYIWFNVDDSGTDPEPDAIAGLTQVGIEISTTENEESSIIADKIATELESYGQFTADISNTTREVAATSELTNVTFFDDTANGNSNYSGKYFTVYNGTAPYRIWFNVGGTSPEPSVSGEKIEVEIEGSSSETDIANIAGAVINDTDEFNTFVYSDNIDIETSDPGNSDDAEENDADSVINISTLREGSDSYTESIAKITIEANEDGAIRNAGNSMIESPGFDFKILRKGVFDPIAILNEEISTTLGLFPMYISSPHEDHYRNFRSQDGTAYVYLLKWIYFTYKYFNEEQFFFQNLLEHYVPEYDSNIISSINNLKIYFDGLGVLLDTIDQKIEDLYTLGNIDEVNENYLQHIAQLLGYQKEDFSIKNISFRELIKNLVEIYQRKGSTYSFELFFKLLGFDADVKEYYWDRDAKNPEGFASITNYNFLYYLTTQNPATRTLSQYETEEDIHSIQPVRQEDWVNPKDLREFEDLQAEYSLQEILGYKDSDLPQEDRFTYFKTNYINFQLTQFYTKQDLTAKDTDTILKYVKFLTPIYVSAFVEVVTTPWEDTFEWENILADDVVIEGGPGSPRWVDILLPFLFVTLKEYIPLNLSPSPEKAVVVTQHGTTDEDDNGFSDSALPDVFGDPDHGIDIQGNIIGSSTLDLSEDKYINIKLDKGRGEKISLRGNTIQTYQQLLDRINNRLSNLGLEANAIEYGTSPNLDIRIRSNETGTSSKIYLANGLIDDLILNLSLELGDPVDGTLGTHGYQELGLNLISLGEQTGLDPSKTYNFYINIDDDEFVEIDVSGENESQTTIDDITNSINNHYELSNNYDFISSSDVQYLESEILTNGKIAVAFRDASTNNGKLVIMNLDGTIYRAGINFSRFDCRNVAISASIDNNTQRFFIAYYDTSSSQLKWSIMDNEGEKEINDRVLEESPTEIKEVQAITLSNNKVFLIYTTASGAFFRIFNIENTTEETSESGPIEWYRFNINNIRACRNNDEFVVTGNLSGSGYIKYFNESGEFAINNSEDSSTKRISGDAKIREAVPINYDNKIFIVYNVDNSDSEDYRAYGTIWEDGSESEPEIIVSPFLITDVAVDRVYSNLTSNKNILVCYIKEDRNAFFKVYDFESNLLKKEEILYDDNEIKEMSTLLTSSGYLIVNLSVENKGSFLRFSCLGELASVTFDGRVQLQSVLAGDTWDDNVENYAQTSDSAHLFTMDGNEYEYDNYSNYLISQGVDFTDERNRYNTFYETSPNDDLVPIIEDTLTFIFTLLIGTNTLPADNVDRLGFYPNRNGYISRSLNPLVSGNDYRGYYLRHQDVSEDIRTDIYRIPKELKWPQWQKDYFDKTKEKTEIHFENDTENNNDNYSGNYFIIYSGITKAAIWYDVDGNSEKPEIDRILLIRININNDDDESTIAQKTRNKMLNHPALNFEVTNNNSNIIIESLFEGETEDCEEGTLSGVISIDVLKDGEENLSYPGWSSWSMAIDYFQPSIEYPAIIATGGANFGGGAFPAGIYEEFQYGIPRGTAAGAWQIDGAPTGEAIIEFTITDTDPSVVWPEDSKVSFISDETGDWIYMDNTIISEDGKKISAVVDHFSVWGVIDSSTGEIVSDEYTVDVNVEDAVVYRIKPITDGPSGLGSFTGTATPYGPYEEFEFISEGGGVHWGGAFYTLIGLAFVAPRPEGGMSISGEAESTYDHIYYYESSGNITIVTIFTTRIVDIIGTASTISLIASGEAFTFFNEYNFYAEGGIILSSDLSEYSYYPEYRAGEPFGWIILQGIVQTEKIYNYIYELVDGGLITGGEAGGEAGYVYDVISYSINLTYDDIYPDMEISYEASGTINFTSIVVVTDEIIIEAKCESGILIASGFETAYEVFIFPCYLASGSMVASGEETAYEANVIFLYLASGSMVASGDTELKAILLYESFYIGSYEKDDTLQTDKAISNDDNIDLLCIQNRFGELDFITPISNIGKISSYNLSSPTWNYDNETPDWDKSAIGPSNNNYLELLESNSLILSSTSIPIEEESEVSNLFVFAGENGNIASIYDNNNIIDSRGNKIFHYNVYTGSGRINITGTSHHSGYNYYSSSGSIELLGSASTSGDYEKDFYLANGSIKLNGEALISGDYQIIIREYLFDNSNISPDNTDIVSCIAIGDINNTVAFITNDGRIFNYSVSLKSWTNIDGGGLGILPYSNEIIGSINGASYYEDIDTRLIVLYGNNIICNYDLDEDIMTFPDGTTSDGSDPREPYLNNYSGEFIGSGIETIRQLLAFHTNTKIINWSPDYGWTDYDGSPIKTGDTGGKEPYYELTTGEEITSTEFHKNSFLVATNNGIIFSYNSINDEWIDSTGVGPVENIYTDNILGSGNSINQIKSATIDTYIDFEISYLIKYAIVAGDNGRLGYIDDYNNIISYNQESVGIPELNYLITEDFLNIDVKFVAEPTAINFNGTAEFQIDINFEFDDGLNITGTNDIDTIELLETASGGVSTEGSGLPITIDSVELIFETFGGSHISGLSEFQIDRILSGEGMAIAQSSATLEIDINFDTESGLNTNGINDIDTIEKNATVESGGMTTSGTNDIDTIELLETMNNGATTSGTNDIDTIELLESSNGGAVANGINDIDTIEKNATVESGGMKFTVLLGGGDSDDTYEDTLTGGGDSSTAMDALIGGGGSFDGAKGLLYLAGDALIDGTVTSEPN